MGRKKIIIVLSAFMIAIVIIVTFSIDMLIMRNALQDKDWWEKSSPYEKRQLAHRVLKRPISFHHDAFIILIEHGNEESIPYLLNGLKWYDFFNRDDDFMECTKIHCLDALRKITGKDLGTKYSDWKKLQFR
ncbi:MAG: hypothetical protein JRF37_03755 [Deltaproteobacteria bacterium]|nr:hypothetical protein [Deltaproteobacteria bacterium]